MIKWNPDYEAQVSTLKPTEFPVAVLVETTAYCNLKCSMCPQQSLKRQKGEMSFDTYRKIVDEIARENPSTRLWLAIMGEALMLGEKLVEMIRYAKEKGLESVNLNTNATLMSPRISDLLVASGLDELIIGLDAFSSDTYSKIRVGGKYEETRSNVEYMLKARDKGPAGKPRVIIQFILMDENEHEFEDFKKYWLERGAVLKLRAKISWGTAIPADHLTRTEQERTFPCPMLIRHCAIHWNGKFAHCSDADYECRFSPGDINTSSIKEVWNGELARRRERHWAGDFSHELCSVCKDWQMGLSEFYYPPKG